MTNGGRYLARVMQHEFDHLDGKMFVDHLSMLRKQMVKGKLGNLLKGNFVVLIRSRRKSNEEEQESISSFLWFFPCRRWHRLIPTG